VALNNTSGNNHKIHLRVNKGNLECIKVP